MIAQMTPQELQTLIRGGRTIELIDVRTPAEFQSVHLSCARNVPLDELNAGALKARSLDEPVYLICQKGGRGHKACELLCAAGVTQAFNIEGGTEACVAAGLSVVRGKKSVSLERQVRMIAGAVVLIGAVLGLTVHPYWTVLSAVIGAGLLFAGITDTCGMAMLLARMPWNRVKCDSSQVGVVGANTTQRNSATCCGR